MTNKFGLNAKISDSSKVHKYQAKINEENNETKILIDKYKNLRKNKDIPGQAHHLNQDAAFKKIIPKNEGVTIKLDGNIRTDVGSPHYKAHETMEKFWDQYRKGGAFYRQVPTIKDYNEALRESLHSAGLTSNQVDKVMRETIKQQEFYGLFSNDFVPRIPGKIYLPKS